MLPVRNDTAWNNNGTNGNTTVYENRTEISVDELGHHDLDSVEITVISIMSAIAVVGFQGNLSVVVVIINNPCLRTSMTNLFVLNLVIVDLLACVLAMPLAIVAYSVRNSNHDVQICEISGFFSTSFMLCSMLTLCVISMDRFYSIAMPLHHAAHSTPLIALVVMIFVWLIGIVVASLPCLGLNSYKFKHHERICSFQWAGDKNDRAFVITIFVISFLIPSLVILSMYSSIFCIARKAARAVAPQPSESTHSTVVNPEPEMSRTENSQYPIPSMEIDVESPPTRSSYERRPRIKIVSLPSEDASQNISDVSGGCQRGFVISYSSLSSNDRTNSNVPAEIFFVNDLAKNLSENLENGGDVSPPSSTQHRQPIISSLQSANSRLENCDRVECNGNPNGIFSFHYTPQTTSNSSTQSIKPQHVLHCLPTGNMNQINSMSGNVTFLNHGQSSSSHEALNQNDIQRNGSKNHNLQKRTPSFVVPTTQRANLSRPKHNKAFRTVMVIVLSYLLLWGPYFVCQVHQSIGGSVSSTIQLLVSWLGFASYTVHPFLYGGMNRLIREELWNLYTTLMTWLHATVFCLCWSCCRCCSCFHLIKKRFFIAKAGGNNQKYSAAVLHCMPWLREEEEEREVTENGVDGDKEGGGDENDNASENFFQFLQRTQDEHSHVPESLMVEHSGIGT